MSKQKKFKVCVLGAGSWGGVVSNLLTTNCCVDLFSITGKRIKNNSKSCSFSISKEVKLKDFQLEAASSEPYEYIFICTPSRVISEVCAKVKESSLISQSSILVSLTKGLVSGTGLTISQILAREFPDNSVVVISGGSHAEEVERHLPFSLGLGYTDQTAANKIISMFPSKGLKFNLSPNPIALEVPAALKNIIAIASGISDSLELGDNFKSYLVSQGLSEIGKIGELLGLEKEDVFQINSISDLLTTAYSEHSRNYRYGYFLGKGLSAQEILKELGMEVEGLTALKEVRRLFQHKEVFLPLMSAVYRIVYENSNPTLLTSILL